MDEPPVTVAALLSDRVTVLSLGLTVVLLLLAYIFSRLTLTPSTSTKLRVIYIWHLFDLLIHYILEGTFVYHSLFSYATKEQLLQQPERIQTLPYRVAGALFSQAPMAKLWQVYAKADLRWGVGEPNIVSMEILTVIGGGTGAAYITYLIAKDAKKLGSTASSSTHLVSANGQGKEKWFWMVVLATAELYGGYMTFVPEWIIGSPSLVTSNWVYKWLYLFFFNALWVWFPGWILYEGFMVLVKPMPAVGVAKKKL